MKLIKKVKKNKQIGPPPPPPPEELLQEVSEPEVAVEQSQSDDDDQPTVQQQQQSADNQKPTRMEIDSNADEEEGNDLKKQSGDDDDANDSDADLMVLQPKKKRKKGIIYVSNIPKHMNVTRIREILGAYGKIGRVYLQPEKLPRSGDKNKKKKKRKPFARHFTEGWVEFESKRVAKQLVELLNNKQISTRKKSQFYDYLWSMKYLPRFKWVHLTERMNYEQAVHKQRLMTEISQARKETTFFQNNLDKSEFIKKTEKRNKKKEMKEKDEAENKHTKCG